MQNYGWIEIVFTAVIAFGFGIWQLWSVNREIVSDRARNTEGSNDAGHAVGKHHLDDG
jgi:hypothetical protein